MQTARFLRSVPGRLGKRRVRAFPRSVGLGRGGRRAWGLGGKVARRAEVGGTDTGQLGYEQKSWAIGWLFSQQRRGGAGRRPQAREDLFLKSPVPLVQWLMESLGPPRPLETGSSGVCAGPPPPARGLGEGSPAGEEVEAALSPQSPSPLSPQTPVLSPAGRGPRQPRFRHVGRREGV